jgi:putative ABC transport system ATP-binding protein
MAAIIEIKNVVRTYKLGDEILNALDTVSFSVQAGEFVAITGPSGSGKSTLANIIGGLDRPNSGTISVQGNNTALENVMLPLVFARMKNKDRRTRAKECLEAVGLGDRLKHKPSQLSGGQRQRVAIARALATKPSIIIADEPTGNLDSAKGEEIMKLLKDLNRDGITLLIITHDMTIAREAHRIVEIRDGKITEKR